MSDNEDPDLPFFDKVKGECILESMYDESGIVPEGWLSIREEKIVEKGTGKNTGIGNTCWSDLLFGRLEVWRNIYLLRMHQPGICGQPTFSSTGLFG